MIWIWHMCAPASVWESGVPAEKMLREMGGWRSREAGLGRMNGSDLRRTVYYLRRNGIRKTWYAVRERLDERKQMPYRYIPPTEEELEAQRGRWGREAFPVTFSIAVPAYRTKPEYLRELIESLRSQTYPDWELVLADATEDDSVRRVAEEFSDLRIRYVRLERNGGIAANTDQALAYVSGDYVGLLDHDDTLSPDALSEMASRIEEGRRRGAVPRLLYSDEDKCDSEGLRYYEPNRKEGFNLDLLLSNNYICHFLVLERELIQRLGLRPAYDGAQDYDLVLRAAAELNGEEGAIIHVPKVLYHWRCHGGSTAENPQSKHYAYEAGRRAVQDFADRAGWRVRVAETAHVGFYALQYQGSPFAERPDLGAIGGRLARRGRTVGGRMTEAGKVLYEGLPIHYSGYLHRAALSQNAEAADIRCIRVRPECRELFRQVTGIPYGTLGETDIFDAGLLPDGADAIRLSVEFCTALRKAGYRILYLPGWLRKQ